MHIGHRVAINLDLWVRALGRFAAELERQQLGDHRGRTKLHRNPLVHPEVILSTEEAIGIIGMARSAIAAMLAALPDVRIATGAPRFPNDALM